jgi:hypothetical protein
VKPVLIVLLVALAAPAVAAPSARAVIEAKFAAVNRHAIADIAALYAPDAVITASDFCKPRQGRADVERTYAGIFGFLPDAQADVQEFVVEGDRVAVALRGPRPRPGPRGRHQDPQPLHRPRRPDRPRRRGVRQRRAGLHALVRQAQT